jgi:nitroreductase
MEITLQAIRDRHSVRSYIPEPLGPEETGKVEDAIAACSIGPFGGRPRFELVTSAAAGLAGGEEAVKVGTYGFIKGAPAFILGAIADGPFANEDYGYCLEGVVLLAAGLGLGTCWLGGALNRGQVARLLTLGKGEFIPCITPLGHPSERRSLRDRIISSRSKGDNRKPFSALFFDGDFRKPLTDAGSWEEVLEAVRLAPSASNKQPWRILRTAGTVAPAFNLFLDEDRIYNSALGAAKMQDVDMGIAMRHFEAAARAAGLPGGWRRLEAPPGPAAAASPANYRYIASWTA